MAITTNLKLRTEAFTNPENYDLLLKQVVTIENIIAVSQDIADVFTYLQRAISVINGIGTLVIGIIPTGLIDNINQDYETPTDYISGTTAVYKNSQRMTLGVDYTETGPHSIRMTTPPKVTSTLIMDYLK